MSTTVPHDQATPSNEQQDTATSPDAGQSREPRMFSQDQVNTLLAEEKRKAKPKYADYEELKAKAAQFDQAREDVKSDLQRAIERAEEAENTLAQREHQLLVAEIAADKGVPAGNLTGTTREELEASADALLAWASPRQEEPRRGFVPKAATGTGERHASSMQAGRGRARAKQAARNTTI